MARDRRLPAPLPTFLLAYFLYPGMPLASQPVKPPVAFTIASLSDSFGIVADFLFVIETLCGLGEYV